MAGAASVNISIPSLKKGECVEDWRSSYTASVALLDDKHAVKLLPIYVNRSPGERVLAEIAAKESSLSSALDKLQTLIDGTTTTFTFMDQFCNSRPTDLSQSGLTAFFFELAQIGVKAGLESDKIIIRYLNVIPCGRKIFDKFKDEIKAQMDDAACIALLQKFQPMFAKKNDEPKVSQSLNKAVKEEPQEMFYTESFTTINEKLTGLQDQLNSLMVQDENVSSDSDSEFDPDDGEEYVFYQKSQNKFPSLKCPVCNKKGHTASKCFKRICKNCNGRGHDSKICPTKPMNKKNSSL